MSSLRTRKCVLNELMLVTSLLINVILCLPTYMNFDSLNDFNYEDYYYNSDIDTYDEPATITAYSLKVGETIMLKCPNHTKIWRSGNGTLLEDISVMAIANGPSQKNVTVRSEDDAGYYDCYNPLRLFFNSNPVLRYHIFIIFSETTMEPESTTSTIIEKKLENKKAMGVDSEYFLVSLLSSVSENSNKSVFHTLTNRKPMAASSVAVKNINTWHILCPMIMSLYFKFY